MKNIALPAKELDRHLRAGQGAAARVILQALPMARLERKTLADYAWLALRADLPMLGVRVLGPIVRCPSSNPLKADAREKAVYAACLGKIGAGDESLALLSELDARDFPEVYLFRAFAHSSRWEFAEAIPALKAYLKSRGPSEYEKLVGKANLAAALVYEHRFLSAEPILRELLFESSARRLGLLRGKAFELTAASFILQRKWEEAALFLERGGLTLQASESRDEFFARKWRAILELARRSASQTSLDDLHRLRDEALQRGYWESVRDCDRYEAVSQHDEGLFNRVYFGSPFPGFRRRLEEEAGFAARATYSWVIRGGGSEETSYDLFGGNGIPLPLQLKPGQLLYRLLSCLVSDFYRPFRLPTLHFQCFPDEFYNPVTSPARIYEALRRLRHWLKDAEVPLRVDERHHAYVLTATAPCTLLIRSDVMHSDRLSHMLRRIQDHLSFNSFKGRELARLLKVSLRSTQLMLGEAVSRGALVREGIGRTTRYRLPRQP